MAGKCCLRTHNHRMRRRIDTNHIEWAFSFIGTSATTNAKAAALADSIVDNTIMLTQYGTIQMHNLPWFNRARPQPPQDIPISAIRHKTDILTVGLLCNGKSVFTCQKAGLVLAHAAKWKAQIVKLFRRCSK